MFVNFLSTLCSLVDLSSGFLFAAVAYLTWKFVKDRNLPPGPRGLPFLGYLPFMGKQPMEETFLNLSRRYGDVISLYFGNNLFIVLNSYEAIKEAFVKQGAIFAGRPSDLNAIENADKGILNQEGETWKEHRRFIVSTFRDYGMGKLSLEPRITEEINCFLDEIAKQNGKPFNVNDLLGISTQNVISALELGKRYDYQDETFLRFRRFQNEFFEAFPIIPILAIFPWISYLPFSELITHKKKIDKGWAKLIKFVEDIVEEHKAEYQEGSRKDLVDAYITERNEVIKRNGEEGSFNALETISTLFTLYAAGAETTTTILRWSFLMVMIHPDIQKKIHDEIDRVIGMERSPSINDRTQMPYTEAFILEVFRFGSINPTNLPHSNVEETKLYGYRIPKRSIIITNLWAVHFDPKLWDHPELFKPERFINEDGKVKNSEHVLAFGIGKRACLGESLGRMEVFLYFASMMQRFELQAPPGTTPKLDIESTTGRRPKPYEFCAIQRKGYSVS